MTDHHTGQRTARAPGSSRLVAVLALACGVAVGNVYFPQALVPLAAADLGVSPGTAAGVVTATQFGYAAGVFLLVPLGDRLPPRPLLVTLLAVTGLGLTAAAAAPALPPLLAASVPVGAATVIAPLAGPLAAGLVPPGRRGVAGGTLLSGSLAGMLLSRTAGGALGERLGWRAPYLLAAVLSLALALLLSRALPSLTPPSRQPYPRLLAEPVRLLRTEPALRRSCLYQATVFAGFSAVWTGVALLLTGPVYGLGAAAVGLLALVNAVTMCVTPYAGRLVDRRGPDAVNLVCFLLVAASSAILALGALGGGPGLLSLVAGTLLLDVGMQSGMVANQVRVYCLGADVRSRLNTAYMTCAYLGGSAGSWLGARAYAYGGWSGVCALVAVLTVLGLLGHLRARNRIRTPERNPYGGPRCDVTVR
ncbi:MFS transporter [Streptomyces sp. MMG1121]|uniref:MFS transporter n=1 Tax=Streptomyces sp. MMG1121 TaxID=1415544 RepID=UPI0006ADFADC|nr:MFS transporter [Streptomyces sp. MMG1121]KOV64639.1 MFS transporter [Streptomyces sp. MMG1121]